jgi:hypothetical protein
MWGLPIRPLLAVLMVPRAPIPLWLRDLVWYASTVAAVIASFKLSEFITRQARTDLNNAEVPWLRLLAPFVER